MRILGYPIDENGEAHRPYWNGRWDFRHNEPRGSRNGDIDR